MTLQIEMFPEELQELNREVTHHPELMEDLSAIPDFETKLGVIASYCNIEVDGYFSPEGIAKLAEVFIHRLRAKRTIILSSALH